jgi:hypothetical protein
VSLPEKYQARYQKVRRFLPALFFVCGGVWDSLTLKRIDNPLDLTILGAYLFLAGAAVVLISRRAAFHYSEYLPAAVQFFFGGLYSAFRVYYFKSSGSFPSLLFMGFIVALLVGNEFLERRFHEGLFTLVIWSLACSMYMTFALPVLLHGLGLPVFLLGLLVSALACAALALASGLDRARAAKPVGCIYALLLVFYLTNVIPPVPLSKKHMGIYHNVVKSDNQYVCSMARERWFPFPRKSERVFTYRAGDAVYCFSSVFAPANLNTRIYHYWYHYDPQRRRYVLKSRMEYPLTGGRDEGYRGYTYKKNIDPGRWRVKLKTEEGKTLGYLNFEIKPADGKALEFVDVRF